MIPEVDDPVEVTFGDVGVGDEVLEFSDIAIHELLDSQLLALVLLLLHRNIMEESTRHPSIISVTLDHCFQINGKCSDCEDCLCF